MSFFRTALNSYQNNQKKRREELKKNIINYYSLAGLGVKDLWSTAYNDTPYGKKLYDTIIKTVSDSSVRCSYCQDKIFHNKNLNIDHILPASIYPQFTFKKNNLAVSCVTCNMFKSNNDYYQYPTQLIKRSYPLRKSNWPCFHPIYHQYNKHIDRFIIQTNYINLRVYIGKTNAGIKICNELLIHVSEYEAKAVANPIIDRAINNLSAYISSHPGSESKNLRNLMLKMAKNI